MLFTRGGYLSVPVAFGARICRVPYITHDSDSTSSLTNRLISGSAKYNAVAMDSKDYRYPSNKIKVVGIPISSDFYKIEESTKEQFKSNLNIPSKDKVLFIIGGGLGSVIINKSMAKISEQLFSLIPELRIYHVVGMKNFGSMKKKYQAELLSKQKVVLFDFINDVYKYSAAADLIITRAGATNLAEFSIQGKACIIIPSPYLTGGHQLKNADYYKENNAAIVVNEKDLEKNPGILLDNIVKIIENHTLRSDLEKNIHKLADPGASEKIAKLILSLSKDV